MPEFIARPPSGQLAGPENQASDEEMVLVEPSESSEYVRKIVVAGILASLSLVVAPIAAYLPRVPGGWGIAYFDPVSLFWIIAFLIAGPFVGIVSMGAGVVGLFFFDPTGIGPAFKLLATLPMILIPTLVIRVKRSGSGGEALSSLSLYSKLMTGGFLLRVLLMIPMNIVVLTMFGLTAIFTLDQILLYVIIINAIQSFGDAAIPYLVVHKTPVFKDFGLW
ncbi:MAG: hypothetical protein ACW99U_06875 [Candidatus Thorarchaeota archaeon]|jgi:hypothetical protein